MKRIHLAFLAVIATALFTFAQETPQSSVDTYSSLADAILAVKHTEANFVRSMLDGHMHAAHGAMMRGDVEAAAAHMALFANEGDNAIGGVRKRLLEGGHHHNADGEAKGIYEPGYVIVTIKAKQQVLEASAAMRKAKTEAEKKAAWDAFAKVANDLIGGE